jgi:hypothetical protein
MSDFYVETCRLGTLMLACLPLQLVAQPSFPDCPQRFPAQASSKIGDWEGWTPGINEETRLSSVGLFDGPPSEGAALIPTRTTDSGNEISVHWKLQGPYAKEIWLNCAYAAGALSLSRVLPEGPATCLAKYRKAKDRTARPISFECK